MSALLDGVIEDCKSCGIETATPEEIERMKQLYEQNHLKHPADGANLSDMRLTADGNPPCFLRDIEPQDKRPRGLYRLPLPGTSSGRIFSPP